MHIKKIAYLNDYIARQTIARTASIEDAIEAATDDAVFDGEDVGIVACIGAPRCWRNDPSPDVQARCLFCEHYRVCWDGRVEKRHGVSGHA